MTATPEDEVEDEDVRQTEDEATEGEATEGDSSATPTVYQRGPAGLPQPPLPPPDPGPPPLTSCGGYP